MTGISRDMGKTLLSSPVRTHRAIYLDLHGHLTAILHAGQVHLPYGGSCKGPLFKVLQLVPPMGAQVIVEGFLERGQERREYSLVTWDTLICTQIAPPLALRCPGLNSGSPSPSPASLTVICFSGMKSALCLTRSKILAR